MWGHAGTQMVSMATFNALGGAIVQSTAAKVCASPIWISSSCMQRGVSMGSRTDSICYKPRCCITTACSSSSYHLGLVHGERDKLRVHGHDGRRLKPLLSPRVWEADECKYRQVSIAYCDLRQRGFIVRVDLLLAIGSSWGQLHAVHSRFHRR